jgi:hypothetical protein
MNEIQLVPTTKEIIEKYLTLLALKEGTNKEINSLEVIYKAEIKQAKKLLHRTKEGEIIYIPNMSNDHLLNTIKILAQGNLQSDTAQKYVQEAKSRGLHNELVAIVNAPQTGKPRNEDFDDYESWSDWG